MTKQNNPITIQKDTSPYLYLTDYSGIYLNRYNPLTLDRGLRILVNESAAATYHLVSFQVWLRFPKDTFTETVPVFSIVSQTETIDFICTPMADSTKARVTTTEPVSMYKNGNFCSSFIIHGEEWSSLYVIFDTPISMSSFTGEIILHPNFVFNNIAQYIYENEIGTITTAVGLTWQRTLEPTTVITNTWGDLTSGTWDDVLSYFVVKSDFTLAGDYIFGNQVGTSIIVNDDLSTVQSYSNGADIFAEVEWQKIEKTLV